MEITDLLVKNAMIMDLQATDKLGVIDEMVNKLYETGRITDKEVFKQGILNREAQTSTGLGDGVAMPHAKNEAVKEATILFAKSNKGVDYEALDGQPTYVFFMIAAPAGANDTHLAALASLSKYLMQPGFIDKLRQTTTPDQVIDLFKKEGEEVKSEAAEESKEDKAPSTGKFVVAVTACTTGIAHTYMAEEALKKKAAEMGVGIKVETNGASGVGNKLTAEDIKRADGVIIAADKAVDMGRFDGKPLISRPVKDGITNSEGLIEEAASGNLPIYHATDGGNSSEDSAEEMSLGKKFYKHLMSGVSTMLPFVIGGGIAIAIAFLLDNAIGVPKDQLANLGTYNEIASLFKHIGGAAFDFMLPVLAGYIAYSIAEKPGMVAGFVAGYIAQSGLAWGHVPYALNSSVEAGVPSGFLGALVGGFVAGGVILLLKKALVILPRALDGIKAILLYPVLGVIITGFAMLLINIPMSAINTGLNDFLTHMSGTSAVLMGALVGGMMSVDMGGPVNKAAYVFATGTLAATVATGGSEVMAATMAGGMVPPLAVFVATMLFKDKFTKDERQAGVTNIVTGLSFITEGAIPFGAADPARAIPSFVVGSAITGALVGFSHIKLMAPHGGIFVLALTSNPLLYLLYIAIGAVIAGVLFGALRKKK
ncbi:fructose-specific PTS transporter subunit EIIC [Streptococcaceae bacterium ESL0687]|nr:fructose-specific PTS transporter subunit EIIC [Streptococcaceae bacterium ESL0687]